MTKPEYQIYHVWDAPTRLFHWINLLCIIGLMAAGTVILWAGALGVSTEGKIILKSIHVYIGYIFAVNLTIRIFWAFVGNSFARWGSILPFGNGYISSLKSYMSATNTEQTAPYQGHNPLGRLAVTALFILLTIMAITGLVLAGTDIYFPPFGSMMQEWVAGPGVNPADVAPYVKDNLDPAAYQEMRDFRKPFIQTHYWVFFGLLGLAILHIVAVVHAEIKSGGGLISAMITGKKILPQDPIDKE